VNTITATPALLSRHQAMGRQDFLRTNFPPRVKRRAKRNAGLAIQQPAPIDNTPTPERLSRAGDRAVKSASPPFVTIIADAALKFQKQLGQDIVLTLSYLQEAASALDTSKGLTASYSGMSVDQSQTEYSHISDRQRIQAEDFRQVWHQLGPNFQRIARELVLENGDGAKSLDDIGRELSGYEDARRARGGITTALRMLSWRIQELLGGHVPVGRMA
jgi:hypothetical protein